MTEAEIKRINFLAQKKKGEGLTTEEAAEQQVLREKYIAGFRESLRSQLDHTLILNEDGTTRSLRRKDNL